LCNSKFICSILSFGVAVNEFKKSYGFGYLGGENFKVAVNVYRKNDYGLTIVLDI
jgi:hypothetical protein